MREIKFRAWVDAHESKMMSWADLGEANSKGYLSLWNTLIGEVEHITPMQYTGLKDKNGVEIYESDVLKSGKTGLNYQVVWDDEEARFTGVCAEPDKDFAMNAYSWERSEVIGNIYQNPELLAECRSEE